MKALATLALAVFSLFSNHTFAADIPPGFEAPGLIDRLLAGEIVLEEKVNNKFDYQAYQRAFAPKASAEAYIKIAINHAAYPNYFKEVQSAKTTAQNADLTEIDYWADVIFKSGIFSYHLYPTGKQLITYAKDAVSESKIDNKITNYPDRIKVGQQITRLVPYEGGILIEDFVDVKVEPNQTGATTVKTEVTKHITRFMPAFRKALAQ